MITCYIFVLEVGYNKYLMVNL